MKTDAPGTKRCVLVHRFFPVSFLAMTFLYCILIFSISSIPALPVAPPFPHFDKLVHLCLYGVLAGIISAGLWKAEHNYSRAMLFLIPVVFSVLYGLTDEVHQLFVEGRSFDINDLAADALGAAAVTLVIPYLYQKKTRQAKTQGGPP